MSRLDPSSLWVSPSELALTTIQPTDPTIVSVEDYPYYPTSIIDDGSEITFDMMPNSAEFIKCRQIYFTFGARIEREDGTPIIAEEDNVGPVCNFAHALWSAVIVQWGHQTVANCTEYGMRSYFSTYINYDERAMKTHLSCSMWEMDTAGHMDDIPGTTNQNEGLKKRTQYMSNGQIVYFRIRLDVDVFKLDKLLPSNVSMKITLQRAKPAFCLMAGKTKDNKPPAYRIPIFRPTLWIPKARLENSVLIGQNKALKADDAKYQIIKVITRTVTISAGVHTYTLDNASNGQIPRRMFFGLTPNEGAKGKYDLNPFNFDHSNVSQVSVYVNGKQHPIVPFRPNYSADNPDWTREYFSMFDATGVRHNNGGFGVHRDDYPNGYCFYGFDLTPNRTGASQSCVQLVEYGNVTIDLQFNIALAKAMTLFIYFEYNTMIKITGERVINPINPTLK